MKKLLSFLVVSLLVCSFGAAFAEEGQLVPQQEVIVDIEPFVKVKGAITITEGWNLIAMPVLPLMPYTVERFIRDIETEITQFITRVYPTEPIELKGNWRISVVAVYKNGQFEKYPKESITYNMVPGEAYFVYAEYFGPRPLYPIKPGDILPWKPSKSITIVGKQLDVPVSLDLNRGWNGAAIAPLKPFQTGSAEILFLYSLNDLSGELSEQSVKATRIAFWSADKQEWEQHNLPYHGGWGENGNWEKKNIIRAIKPDEGFFLLCEENGLLIPMLPEVKSPELPIPPKPPIGQIITKIGTIEATMHIPEDYTPYVYRIVEAEGKSTPVLAATDIAEKKMQEVAGNRMSYRVSGMMKTIEYSSMLPPYTKTVDVLMVDSIEELWNVLY